MHKFYAVQMEINDFGHDTVIMACFRTKSGREKWIKMNTKQFSKNIKCITTFEIVNRI